MDQGPVVVWSSGAAQEKMLELGLWAATLDERIRAFVASRGVASPPVIYRFSHPVRRALPSARASVNSWEAYPPVCSESGVWEIHLHPRETDPQAVVLAALSALARTIAGPDAKFGRVYRRAAASLGLAAGPGRRGARSWRNTVVAQERRAEVQGIAEALGVFPLGALDASKARGRAADRNFRKAVCPTCGSTNARLSKKAFEERIFLCGGLREAPHAPAVVTLGQDTEEAEAAGPAGRGGRFAPADE
jgi:hypothetical protein